MNKTFRKALPLLLLPMLASCFGGFLEPQKDETVFYIMRARPVEKVAVAERTPINLMPITIPSYMNRNQIVSAGAGGMVLMSEFERWAESAQSGLTRVLAEDISATSENLDIYAYPNLSHGAFNLKIIVHDCIGTLGGDLVFKGKWQLDSAASKLKIARDFSFKTPCGETNASYVESINECAAKLAADIAKTISSNKEK